MKRFFKFIADFNERKALERENERILSQRIRKLYEDEF